MRETISGYLDSKLSLTFLEALLETTRHGDYQIELPQLAQGESSLDSESKLRLDEFAESKIAHLIPAGPDRTAFLAGLYQIEDFLEPSHELAQSVQGKGKHQAGDYWHAILHRREPDDSNAKYWFRRVGDHPVFDRLKPFLETSDVAIKELDFASEIQSLFTNGKWDPFLFVDYCSQARQSQHAPKRSISRYVQWVEMLLLLQQTYRDAIGETA